MGRALMLAKLRTSTINGLEAREVQVEACVQRRSGEKRFSIIGLGDSAVKEAKGRVSSAIQRFGFRIPDDVLINLSPAELKKEGACFDLAIALAVLLASEQVHIQGDQGQSIFLGELALDGKVLPVRAGLAHALGFSQERGVSILLPEKNLFEVSSFVNQNILGISSLQQAIDYLRGDDEQLKRAPKQDFPPKVVFPSLDEVIGQTEAKLALEIAAAGKHHVLFVGPPGCGKSMLAERFPAILPFMSPEERLESLRIHSVAEQARETLFAGIRPFRSPHHGISEAGLIGGGSIPRPGEICLAHHGVLFLDEFPEFKRSAVEALRSPMERGRVLVSRARGQMIFPADFQLVAAMNPCPCGRLGTPGAECLCSRAAIEKYLAKVSQPILDRIDLQVTLEAVPFQSMLPQKLCRDSVERRKRVAEARAFQLKRQGKLNSKLGMRELFRLGGERAEVRALLEKLQKAGNLSARSCVRIMRVARTLADLKSEEFFGCEEIAQAARFRGFEQILAYCRG